MSFFRYSKIARLKTRIPNDVARYAVKHCIIHGSSVQRFLFPDWLHGFPGLFTDTSEHIRLF